MPSQREIRRRIGSVKNIRQITRAMQFVAASKLKRAQDATLASRPYGHSIDEVIADLASVLGEEGHPLGGFASLKFAGILGEVIATEDEILGRSGDGFAARWREEVVGCKHQQSGFHLCLHGERDMDGHLIAVKVSVVSRTNEGMNANCFTLNELGLKCLNG